ncbi:unnamed protein product [Ixodes persulcatus]
MGASTKTLLQSCQDIQPLAPVLLILMRYLKWNVQTFYPSCMSSVSPLSRIQLEFNKAHLSIFLASYQFIFHARRWMSSNYLLCGGFCVAFFSFCYLMFIFLLYRVFYFFI